MQQSRTLLIDDCRDLRADVIARNFEAGKHLLTTAGPWDCLLLDHDLSSYGSDGREQTGYDIACLLERFPALRPQKVILVTSNPVGRERIAATLLKAGYMPITTTSFTLAPIASEGE